MRRRDAFAAAAIVLAISVGRAAAQPSPMRAQLEAAAASGQAAAAYQLGLDYRPRRQRSRGCGGSGALDRQAAEGGLPAAAFNVAVMLDAGRGTARDPAGAALWYARAAAHGHKRAAYNLGQLYSTGEGAPAMLQSPWPGIGPPDRFLPLPGRSQHCGPSQRLCWPSNRAVHRCCLPPCLVRPMATRGRDTRAMQRWNSSGFRHRNALSSAFSSSWSQPTLVLLASIRRLDRRLRSAGAVERSGFRPRHRRLIAMAADTAATAVGVAGQHTSRTPVSEAPLFSNSLPEARTQILLAWSGGPGVIVLTGPPGSGKTKLLDQLAASFRQTGRIVHVAGRGERRHSGGSRHPPDRRGWAHAQPALAMVVRQHPPVLRRRRPTRHRGPPPVDRDCGADHSYRRQRRRVLAAAISAPVDAGYSRDRRGCAGHGRCGRRLASMARTVTAVRGPAKPRGGDAERPPVAARPPSPALPAIVSPPPNSGNAIAGRASASTRVRRSGQGGLGTGRDCRGRHGRATWSARRCSDSYPVAFAGGHNGEIHSAQRRDPPSEPQVCHWRQRGGVAGQRSYGTLARSWLHRPGPGCIGAQRTPRNPLPF